MSHKRWRLNQRDKQHEFKVKRQSCAYRLPLRHFLLMFWIKRLKTFSHPAEVSNLMKAQNVIDVHAVEGSRPGTKVFKWFAYCTSAPPRVLEDNQLKVLRSLGQIFGPPSPASPTINYILSMLNYLCMIHISMYMYFILAWWKEFKKTIGFNIFIVSEMCKESKRVPQNLTQA